VKGNHGYDRKNEPTNPERNSAEFKAKAVTAALREDQTLNQLSARFGMHPVVIGGWKKQALLALPGLFGQKVQRDAEAVAVRERELYAQSGRLEMENACLMKKLGPLD
jgi:transposase-like protein